jgi:hypothetical protein
MEPGMIAERFNEAVEAHNGEVHLNRSVLSLGIEAHRVRNVAARRHDGMV